MSLTAKQFEAAALSAIAQYPGIAALAAAGDPRVIVQIKSFAVMLEMLSVQLDTTQFEPFAKARDATVLADAAMRGILPLARSAVIVLDVTNHHSAAYALADGRRLMDPHGRIFCIDTAVTIQPGQTVRVRGVQRTIRTVAHQVGLPRPFYSIEVPQTTEPVYLSGLELWRRASEDVLEQFAYVPEWFNVGVDEKVFQVEVDEQRRMFVQLGKQDVVGYGARLGDNFELRISESVGALNDLAVGDQLTPEYVYTPADSMMMARLVSVSDNGSAPSGIDELRIISRYPAIYDHNAVYLGEFTVLLRRYLPAIRFLAVWNEQVEEAARGPNLDSVNSIFVAGLVTNMTDAVFRERVAALIYKADTSYKLRFVAPVITPIAVTVTARIAVVHDLAAVTAQIRALIIGRYADGCAAVSEGLRNPIKVQAITKMLRDEVPALQDNLCDFHVSVAAPSAALPENFLQVTEASLIVNAVHAEHSTGLWNY
jgi:hypothetical protein